MDKPSYVYILSDRCYGTLYIGVTSNLIQRIWQHREACIDGFSKKYRTNKLVWFETHSDIREAITREKQIKKWNRAWKIAMIQKTNPQWRDLFLDFAA